MKTSEHKWELLEHIESTLVNTLVNVCWPNLEPLAQPLVGGEEGGKP